MYLSVDQDGVKKAALAPCPKLVDHETLVPPRAGHQFHLEPLGVWIAVGC